MQEEVNEKTVALSFRATKLTAEVLKKAIKLYLGHLRNKSLNHHGKISVKKLMGKDAGASSIEITDKNIKDFEKFARKYNVDFAVKKDKSVNPPRYVVFFKARDMDAINEAFKDYVKDNARKAGRPSLKKKLELCVQKVQAMQKTLERVLNKVKDRGTSL